MPEFETKLLMLAFQYQLGSVGNSYRFLPKDSNELINGMNALMSLRDDDYINVKSDNLDKNILNVLSDDMVFVYSLTNKGLDLVRSWINP